MSPGHIEYLLHSCDNVDKKAGTPSEWTMISRKLSTLNAEEKELKAKEDGWAFLNVVKMPRNDLKVLSTPIRQ